MKKIISANNITEETIKASGNPDGYKNIPDIKSLSDKALAKGKKTIDKNNGKLNSWDKPYSPDVAKGRLSKIFNSIPKNFKLTPVLYTKISKKQNEAVYKEFTSKVKPRFLRFLAKKHSNDLRNLGICEYGIQRMHKGLDPSDKDGKLYNVNVDHVIERSGSGKLGEEKSQDPNIPLQVGETYKVNHFNNLMLMTYPVHMVHKNTINDTQKLYRMRVGDSKWMSMMTPIRSEEKPRFVFVPDDMDKNVKGAVARPENFSSRIGHLKYTLDIVADSFDIFLGEPNVDKAILNVKSEKEIDRKSFFKIMRAGNETLLQKRNDLTSAFNNKMQMNKREKKYHDERLVSLVSDAFDLLEEIYKTSSEKGIKSEEWKRYENLLKTASYTSTIKKLFLLPSSETNILRERYNNLRDNIDYTRQTGRYSSRKFGR